MCGYGVNEQSIKCIWIQCNQNRCFRCKAVQFFSECLPILTRAAWPLIMHIYTISARDVGHAAQAGKGKNAKQ